jgi:membrane protease YdiL (CAAX protease family)
LKSQNYYNIGWQRILFIVIPYILIVGAFQALGYYLAGLDIRSARETKTSEEDLIVMGFTLLGTVVFLALCLRFIDNKRFKDLGLHKLNAGRDSAAGIWLGFVIMFVGLGVLLITDQVQVGSFSFDPYELVLAVLLFVLVSINEEILVRGYVLQNLMLSYNKNVALIISSVLFSVMHIFNPDVNLAGMLSLFLAGILLGVCYLSTGNLWLPIALHFSWNFFQCLFGFNISGNDHYSLITLVADSENIWNGGKFGFEGSVFGSLFQIPAVAYIYYKYRKR